MPTSLTYDTTQSYTIPSDIYSMRIRLYGSGGGGEYISSDYTLTSTAGSSGTTTSFIGLNAGGGVGGGVGGKNLGGGGGSPSTSYNWASLGAVITSESGSGGGINAGGTGGGGTATGVTRNGGSGTPGQFTYTSYVYHVFDNTSNTHIVTQTSPDITVGYESPYAADGISCGVDLNSKHYSINFNIPFVDNSYTISIYGVCQQAAGGGTGGSSFGLSAIAYKSQYGFRAWFCRYGGPCTLGGGCNGYVRCFTVEASGQKQGAIGRGGGGGAFLETTLTRSMFVNSSTYAPGTTHSMTIGTGGASGGVGAGTGMNGYANLYIILVPTVYLSSTKLSLVYGQSATLSWYTTGDADSISWSSGGLTNTNLTSSTNVTPYQTTTYTATASGLGGTSAPATITIVVYQFPLASITVPTSLNYGEQGVISYDTEYANTSIVVTPIYTYDDGVVTGSAVNLTPASSAESGAVGTDASGTFNTSIPYNNYGPRFVQYNIVATGSGGEASASQTTTIIIDETPNNIIIPEVEEAFNSQDPVVAPDYTVLSNYLQVSDIDIPVEIKASRPIQVDINQQDLWKDLRSL